jgi:hypothetical protein
LDFEQLTLLNSSFVLQETQDTHKNEIERAGGKKKLKKVLYHLMKESGSINRSLLL